MKIRFVLVGMFLLSDSVLAGNPNYRNRVTQVASCASILTVLHAHSLHLQDLDNTIMKPKQMLGSDQWYEDLVKRSMAEGLEKAEAVEKAIAEWIPVQQVTEMVPLEDFIPNMISFLIQGQDHLRDAGLTARPPELADATIRQLASMGIDFSKRNPFGGAKRIEINTPEFPGPILIQGGVIFIGPKNNKGKVLAYLLDPKNGYNSYHYGFERIVFADDKLHHNESVLKEVREKFPEMSVYAFRDGAADKDIANYNRLIADRQLLVFKESGRLISDEDAILELAKEVRIPDAK